MSLSNVSSGFGVVKVKLLVLALALGLAGCQFEPLHGSRSASGTATGLGHVGVASVDNRVAQQVRNRLLFLLNGGVV